MPLWAGFNDQMMLGLRSEGWGSSSSQINPYTTFMLLFK